MHIKSIFFIVFVFKKYGYLQTANKMFTVEIKRLGSDILNYLLSKKGAHTTKPRT